MTIIDCCVSFNLIKKNLVVLGVVDMRQLLLNTFKKVYNSTVQVHSKVIPQLVSMQSGLGLIVDHKSFVSRFVFDRWSLI